MLIDKHKSVDVDRMIHDVIGIAANIGSYDSGRHCHHKGQLLFAESGCISILLEEEQSILPPYCAVWIPSGVMHNAKITNAMTYRALYFSHDLSLMFPRKIHIFQVNPLLRQLIERVALWEWEKQKIEQHHTLALLIEEVNNAPANKISVVFPKDRRLVQWLKNVIEEELLPQPLNQVALSIGASEKIITRIFMKETQMPYQSWRQQWRLFMAIKLLSKGESISNTASILLFSCDSAFIAFFKKQTGKTPKKYFAI